MALHIYLLGQFSLFSGQQPVELSSRPAQSLLAYLAIHAGMNHRREKLAGLLWPEATEANARGYLRQGLWRIRKSLESVSLNPEAFLQSGDVSVTFLKEADYWLDVDQLLEPVDAISAEQLRQTLSLYRGELLPGFYEEWIEPEREHIEAIFQQKMNRLLERLLDNGQWSEAIEWSEAWIRLAHSPEPAYRALLRAYAGLDDLSMVRAVYQRCIAALERELGVEPSSGTHKLYEQILRGVQEPARSPRLQPMAEDIRQPPFLDETRLPPVPRSLFVARNEELAQLDGFLGRTLTGQGRVTFVTGEAGSGKTAILSEFSRRSLNRHPDLIIASGGCNAHTGIGDPYLPFREILEMLTGDVQGRWAAGVIDTDHARLLWQSCPIAAKALVETAPDLINTFIPGPAVVERMYAHSPEQPDWVVRLGEVAERGGDGTIAAMFRQSDLFEQYTRLLQTIARQVPVLLIVDDLQWADLGSLSLLFHLGRHLAGCRIMILGAYRPEELVLGRDGERHPLEPVVNELQRQFGSNSVGLDEAESRAFVEAILDSEPNALGPSFRYMICRQTRGNPLFTIELLRGMQERGDLRLNDSGQWIEGPGLDWETLPARVEAVIAERISRLNPLLQMALQTASVEGEIFTAEVVARILGLTVQEVLAAFGGELDRKHKLVWAHSILRRDGQTLSSYRFRHILFQKYLYNQLDEVERVHLHERVGTALEALYGGEPGSAAVAPQLARHFQEARITVKAVHYLHEAGKRSLSVSAYQEAITHLIKGLELLMATPPSAERDQQELVLQIALAIAMQNTKGSHSVEVKATCNRALELYHPSDGILSLSQILGSLATHHYVRAEFQTAFESATQGLAVAEQAGDPLLIALAHWYMGLVSFYRGEFVQAREHFSPIITLYDPVQHRDRLLAIRGSDAALAALAYDACCLWVLGYPDQARQRSETALTMARDFGHFFTLADAVCYGGCMFNELRRDAGLMMVFVEEFFCLIERGISGGWIETATYSYGVALVLSQRAQEGIEQLRRYFIDGKAEVVLLDFPGAYRSIAEAYGLLSQVTEGLAVIDQGFSSIEETGARLWECELNRTQAGLLLLQGDETAAEHSLNAAILAARRRQAKSFELRASVDLARLWQQQGRSDEAREILSDIYGWFREGFDEPDLIRARELLEALA